MATLIHPAVLSLVSQQSLAKMRRMRSGFSTRRRFLLSMVALILGVVWLGNAAASILLREPLAEGRFHGFVTTGLMIYALWHFLRCGWERPESGIEWTPAEREMLWTSPLSHRDLVTYRMCSIVTSATLKAICFSLLMLPDLSFWCAGFVGMLLALMFLDLLRMSVEIWTHGLSRRGFLCYRVAVFTVATGVVASAMLIALSHPAALQEGSSPASLEQMKRILSAGTALQETLPGRVLRAPMALFTGIMTAPALGGRLAFQCLLGGLGVAGMACWVLRWDRWWMQVDRNRQRREFASRTEWSGSCLAGGASRDGLNMGQALRLRRCPLPHWRGLGPIAWRQLLGARRQWVGIALALVAPTVFACLPLWAHTDSKRALLNVIGALAFYSFLLLPAALKFDFRRDVDRLFILKSLPLPAVAITLGQLLTPVLIASWYQLCVLTVAVLWRPVSVGWLFAAMALLVPMNVLIFALDNAIFLCYPHRLKQEGLQVFLRTTLTFTFKGILFGCAVAAMVAWVFIAAHVSRHLPGILGTPGVLFVSGAWWMLCAAAAGTYALLVKAYLRFDASQDVPA